MVRFFENYSLKAYNTFGVDATAKYFFEFTEVEDLLSFAESDQLKKDVPLLVLGGGSNLLFVNDFDGLVIHPNIPGLLHLKEDRSYIWLETGGGEPWDDFVQYCVNFGYGGVENLSLIPGTVGAAPVQNIGAYGQEVSNVIDLVRGYDLDRKEVVEFSAGECEFAYRNSIFKRNLKNRVIITSVVFRLDKYPEYILNYGNLEEKVNSFGDKNLHNIRKAIIDIRSSKLPDVTELGSAGSFFKNPVIDEDKAEGIRSSFPDIPVFPAENGKMKIAAGWMIEKAGWKGYTENNAGVHDKQALVIVNFGNASGKDIFDLSEKIRNSVLEKFGVDLEREVNCI